MKIATTPLLVAGVVGIASRGSVGADDGPRSTWLVPYALPTMRVRRHGRCRTARRR